MVKGKRESELALVLWCKGLECGQYALCSSEIGNKILIFRAVLSLSLCSFFSFLFYIVILFLRCPDISSGTGIVGESTGKIETGLVFKKNYRLNLTVIPRRPQHLPTWGKQIPSLRLRFLIWKSGEVCTLNKVMGCLVPIMLVGEKRLVHMK